MSFVLEKKIAELAVKRASRLARTVAETHVDAITKTDQSPVTVADYGAQAIIIGAIKHAFPQDKVVGEEEATNLRADSKLKEHVWALVKEASAADNYAPTIGTLASADAMCDAIDGGNYQGGAKGRMWALDPIDGTKGFLRKGQYAVCLALVVDSEVEIGVVGCPNLPLDYKTPETTTKGVLFSAVKGQGAFQQALFDSEQTNQPGASSIGSPTKIHFNDINDTSESTFCESVEAAHSDQSTQSRIAKSLGITREPVRMDSQAKYMSIARGDGDIYLRLPVNESYEEKIWDHAAGNVIVTEAGGIVSDRDGNKLDFGVGRTLKNNKGVIATSKKIHSKVIAAVKEANKE